MEPLPSKSALVRIGKALAAGTETDAQLDQLDVLLGRYDEVKARAVDRLIDVLASLTLDSGATLSVRGRTKTLVTLREKLVRMGGHQLPVIRDLAGLRIVGDMTLAEQDEVLLVAANALGSAEGDTKIIDRRTEPMQGYRALHGELSIEGMRVEIQVRTLLQHEWAELSERAADHYGRAMRYDSSQETAVLGVDALGTLKVLQEASEAVEVVERADWRLIRHQFLEEATEGSAACQVIRSWHSDLLVTDDFTHRLSEIEHHSSTSRKQALHLFAELGHLLARDIPEERR